MAASDSENPYSPPRTESISPEDLTCSFCRKRSGQVGALVEAADGGALICRACARRAMSSFPRRTLYFMWRVLVSSWLPFVIAIVWDKFFSDDGNVTLRFIVVLVIAFVSIGVVNAIFARRRM